MVCLVIELFGLEGIIEVPLVQLPCSQQRHLQLGQVAHSPVQPDLECFHDGIDLGRTKEVVYFIPGTYKLTNGGLYGNDSRYL